MAALNEIIVRNSSTRATCLINNFNYGRYVGEAVESALRQTRKFDQILVIDDGSTDGSLSALEKQFGREPAIQIVGKKNGGQLSCFNTAMPMVIGDVLFFLDADDRYRQFYLETALHCYERTAADFLVAGLENFGGDDRRYTPCVAERDLGFSVITTLFARSWIGGPTSCLSMRTSMARRILPYPFEAEWRLQADNVLVYGASLFGAHKYQLGQSLVERRVHDTNLFYGRRRFDLAQSMRFELHKNRLFAWCIRQAGFNVADLPRLLSREFRTHERPTFKEFRRYLRLSWTTQQTPYTKAKQTLSLTAHMLRFHRRTPATEQHAAREVQTLHRAA
jgi:glycosyltransferase involved in cell wall biosynthesis